MVESIAGLTQHSVFLLFRFRAGLPHTPRTRLLRVCLPFDLGNLRKLRNHHTIGLSTYLLDGRTPLDSINPHPPPAKKKKLIGGLRQLFCFLRVAVFAYLISVVGFPKPDLRTWFRCRCMLENLVFNMYLSS
jgi:hypothetical protein